MNEVEKVLEWAREAAGGMAGYKIPQIKKWFDGWLDDADKEISDLRTRIGGLMEDNQKLISENIAITYLNASQVERIAKLEKSIHEAAPIMYTHGFWKGEVKDIE